MFTRETTTVAGNSARVTAGNQLIRQVHVSLQVLHQTVPEHLPLHVSRILPQQYGHPLSRQRAGMTSTGRLQAGTAEPQEQIITIVILLHQDHLPAAMEAEQQEAEDSPAEAAADEDKMLSQLKL